MQNFAHQTDHTFLGSSLPSPLSQLFDVKHVFFSNLQLLGFDIRAMEAKYRRPFNVDMFKLPNKAGSEVVLYFLFSKLDPVMCREEFRDCWPIRDKETDRLFRKTCCNWLTNVSKDGDSHFPRINSSIFLTPGGEKFYQLLFSFSRYVLQHTIKTDNITKERLMYAPVLNVENKDSEDVMYKNTECASIKQRQEFLEDSKQLISLNATWKQNASELIRENRRLTKISRDLERGLRELKHVKSSEDSSQDSSISIQNNHTTSHDADLSGLNRTKKRQHVLDMWNRLDDFAASEMPKREVINSILNSHTDKHCIDSGDIQFQVPSKLIRNCQNEIMKKGADSTYIGGKLNLLSLIKLSNISLNLYSQTTSDTGIPDLKEDFSHVSLQVHTHHSHVASIQSLRTKSTELILSLKESINDLQEKWNKQMQSITPERLRATNSNFGLQPTTPPISFTPDQENTSKVSTDILRGMSAYENSTPEAVAKLIDTVSEQSRGNPRHLFMQSPVVHSPPKSKLQNCESIKKYSKIPGRANVIPNRNQPNPARRKELSDNRSKPRTDSTRKESTLITNIEQSGTKYSHSTTVKVIKEVPSIPSPVSPSDREAEIIADSVIEDRSPLRDMTDTNNSFDDSRVQEPIARLPYPSLGARIELEPSPLKDVVREMWKEAISNVEQSPHNFKADSSSVRKSPSTENNGYHSFLGAAGHMDDETLINCSRDQSYVDPESVVSYSRDQSYVDPEFVISHSGVQTSADIFSKKLDEYLTSDKDLLADLNEFADFKDDLCEIDLDSIEVPSVGSGWRKTEASPLIDISGDDVFTGAANLITNSPSNFIGNMRTPKKQTNLNFSGSSDNSVTYGNELCSPVLGRDKVHMYTPGKMHAVEGGENVDSDLDDLTRRFQQIRRFASHSQTTDIL